MSRNEIRGLHTNHLFSWSAPGGGSVWLRADEEPISLVSDFLNRLHSKPENHRLEQIFKDMNELDRLARDVGYPRDLAKRIQGGSLGPRAATLHSNIRRLWDKMEFTAVLGLPGKGGWEIDFCAPPEQFDKLLAGSLLLHMATGGLLRFFVDCPTCGKWFIARRKNQRFCSQGCREKNFRSSDAGKAKRARYMQGYRERLKRRDRENLRVTKNKKRR
jgi:hypothetical protein